MARGCARLIIQRRYVLSVTRLDSGPALTPCAFYDPETPSGHALCALVLAAAGAAAGSPLMTTGGGRSRALATGFYDPAAFGSSDASAWFGRAAATGAERRATRQQLVDDRLATPRDPTQPADPVYQWAALRSPGGGGDGSRDSRSDHLTHRRTQLGAGRSRSPRAPHQRLGARAADYRPFAQHSRREYSDASRSPAPGRMLPRVRLLRGVERAEPLDIPGAAVEARTGHMGGRESADLTVRCSTAFYAGVKAGQADAVVVAGDTAPFGRPAQADSGSFFRGRQFDRILLCLSATMQPLPCPDPAHFDVLDHHPYGRR